jgi:hypothetical protein
VLITSSSGHGGTGNYSETVPEDTTVTLTAPAVWSGRTFASWSGAVNSTDQTIDVTMTADTSVTANYTRSAFRMCF